MAARFRPETSALVLIDHPVATMVRCNRITLAKAAELLFSDVLPEVRPITA